MKMNPLMMHPSNHWEILRISWHMFVETWYGIYEAYCYYGLRPGDKLQFTATVNITGGPGSEGGIRFELQPEAV